VIISVVTPSYNQARFIERTIQSVLSQEGNFEIDYFVADGGSNDGTLDILKRHSDRLRYVSEPDRGPTDAIAKGFRAARGDIVAWLNSDDVYCPGALQRVKEAFEAAPQARWLCGRCGIMDVEDRETRRWITAYKNWWLRRYSFRKLLVLNFISQPAVFLRRSVIEEIGAPDQECKVAFDYAYWLRIASRHPPLILDDYLARFRAYPASLGGGNPRIQFREERDTAARYSHGMPFVRLLHSAHARMVVSAYAVMRWFGPRGRQAK
jgi:glycosyltransferase involved in cell wall biosynthesis